MVAECSGTCQSSLFDAPATRGNIGMFLSGGEMVAECSGTCQSSLFDAPATRGNIGMFLYGGEMVAECSGTCQSSLFDAPKTRGNIGSFSTGERWSRNVAELAKVPSSMLRQRGGTLACFSAGEALPRPRSFKKKSRTALKRFGIKFRSAPFPAPTSGCDLRPCRRWICRSREDRHRQSRYGRPYRLQRP
jgi:hypothetical protein